MNYRTLKEHRVTGIHPTSTSCTTWGWPFIHVMFIRFLNIELFTWCSFMESCIYIPSDHSRCILTTINQYHYLCHCRPHRPLGFNFHVQAFGRCCRQGADSHPWHTDIHMKKSCRVDVLQNISRTSSSFSMVFTCFFTTSQGDEDQEYTDPAIPHPDLVQCSGFSAKTLCALLP